MTSYNTIPDRDWDALKRSAEVHGENTIGDHISSPGLGPDAHEMPASMANRN